MLTNLRIFVHFCRSSVNHNRYDWRKSKATHKRQNHKFKITYGTGAVKGFTSINTIHVSEENSFCNKNGN